MDTGHPGPSTATAIINADGSARAGVFGTKMPSLVAFSIGVLLFLLPFAEFKCQSANRGGTDVGGFRFNINSGPLTYTNKGVGIAFGTPWKLKLGAIGGLLNSVGVSDSYSTGTRAKANPYAIAALAFGVIGLIFSIINIKGGGIVSVLAGVISAGALIGLMLDLKKKIKNPLDQVDSTGSGTVDWTLDKVKDLSLSVSFTPWYYLCILAFLTAAFFSYKRMSASN